MKNLIILIIALMAADVSAAGLHEYRVYNFNTAQPVAVVNIAGDNGTYSYLNVTDSSGNAILSFLTNESLSVTFSRSGYETKTISRNYTSADSTEDIFLNAQSTSGIIRLYINDLSGSDHINCVYFTDNGRLYECATVNSSSYTIIHTSMNYTFRPSITRSDLVSSPQSILTYGYLWLPFIIAMTVIGMLIAVLSGLIISLYKKTKRR
jgi:hypothetical protein